MLLPLRSISRLLRPLQPSHARSVTTFPKPIPTYTQQWDPTRHAPQSDVIIDSQAASRDNVRRLERAQLRQSQEIEVLPQGQKDYAHEGRADIIKLNHLLRLPYTRLDRAGLRLMIWHTYRRLRGRFPEALRGVSHRAWDILWKIQQRGLPTSNNASHPRELESDMAQYGYESVGQRIKYLNGLFLKGQEEQALQEWEEDYNGTNHLSRHDYKPEHLELGARMYAVSGHPDRAREIMEELFELYPSWDSSIMNVVFRAHTNTSLARHHDLAKSIYEDLKKRLKNQLTLQDYDACFFGFLEARHLENSLMVFSDTIKQGRLTAKSSIIEVDKILTRLHMLFRLGTDISKTTSIGLQAITVLPRAYHTHVFDHWMRSAVIRNAPEAAAQLIDLMFNHGCQPQTIHFNLLLKALMQTKLQKSDRDSHVLKAENIGWQMIEAARRAPVERLPKASASEFISNRMKERLERRETLKLDKVTMKSVPEANVTTFAIMMKHHGAQSQWEYVDYLMRQLKECRLQPNAALMNIMMDNKCRQGKFDEVWKIYKTLTDVPEDMPGVFPDGASIRCLWKMLRLALGDHASRDDPRLPQPRELLAETVQWWTRCQARPDAERFRIGLTAEHGRALPSLVMHCFSYAKDLAGSLVGLHILRKKFDIFPSDHAAVILQRHAAWVDMRNKTPHERSSFHHSGTHKANVNKLSRVYRILVDRRWKKMGITKDDYAKLTDDEIGDLNLNLLSEFIRVIMKRSHDPQAMEAMINQAKDEAGVPDMLTGDLDAFQVA